MAKQYEGEVLRRREVRLGQAYNGPGPERGTAQLRAAKTRRKGEENKLFVQHMTITKEGDNPKGKTGKRMNTILSRRGHYGGGDLRASFQDGARTAEGKLGTGDRQSPRSNVSITRTFSGPIRGGY